MIHVDVSANGIATITLDRQDKMNALDTPDLEALVAAYCASKAAVININQSLALALAPYGVNVNAMAPGVVDTPYWKEVDKQFGQITGKAEGETFRDVAQQIPLGRTSVPQDVVPLALFLASPGSDYITAQTYNVEGGMVMS